MRNYQIVVIQLDGVIMNPNREEHDTTLRRGEPTQDERILVLNIHGAGKKLFLRID